MEAGVVMDGAQKAWRHCTSAGLIHMNELIGKAHDVRMLLLAHIGQEVEQRLLQIS